MGAPVVKDPQGRVIDHLRLSVIDRCNLRCTYCMPERGVEKLSHARILSIEEMALVARVLAEQFGVDKVRLTGGEPLVRAGIDHLVSLLAGLELEDLALTTNGQLLAPMARDLRAAGLERVNISLDTLDEERYRRLTSRGHLTRTLEGIDAAIEAGLVPVKINVVALRGFNEDEWCDLARFGLEKGCQVRFLELMPIGVAHASHDRVFARAEDVLSSLAARFRLDPLEEQPGSTARLWAADDGRRARGRIGIISPETMPFCDTCGRLRLTTTGRLLGCLHQEQGEDLSAALRDGPEPDLAALRDAIARTIANRPACRQGCRRSPMHAVGG